MSIKKSSLEQKWYYRIIKIFFLLLPLLIAAFGFLKGYINISNISWKNMPDILQKNSVYIIYAVAGIVLYYLILKLVWRIFLYAAFGGLEDDTKKSHQLTQAEPLPKKPNIAESLAVIVIIIIIAIFVLSQNGYIKLPKINIAEDQQYGAPCIGQDGKNGLYGTDGKCHTCSGEGTMVTNPTGNCSSGKVGVYCCTPADKDDKCIPTGCSPGWWCSGHYYIDGQQINVPGLCFPTHPRNIYPSWSGTCRQCPS